MELSKIREWMNLGKVKVTVTGVASKPPKIKDDKTVDLVLKVDASPSVPKGLKPLGQSICLVHIAPKTWKKIAGAVKDDSFYIIQGDVKASANSKGVLFLEVVAFDISLKVENAQKGQPEKKELTKKQAEEKTTPVKVAKQQKKESAKPEQKKVEQPAKKVVQQEQKNKNITTPVKSGIPEKKKQDKDKSEKKSVAELQQWYKSEDIEYIARKDIVLTEKIHLETKSIMFNGVFKAIAEKQVINKPIVVKKIDNEKYSLVMGMRNYIAAKVFELEKVPVIVVKDISHDEFVKKYYLK
jgi:hypothetical protein